MLSVIALGIHVVILCVEYYFKRKGKKETVS